MLKFLSKMTLANKNNVHIKKLVNEILGPLKSVDKSK